MANLITTQQKKNIKKDYNIRLLTTIFFLIFILGLFVLAYVAPYYFYVKHSYLMIINQFEKIIIPENNENIGESMSRIVNRTVEETKVVTFYTQNTLKPSEYLEKIVMSLNPNIKISRLVFGSNKNKEFQFLVSGLSSNREGLVVFIDDLKKEDSFLKVESPVSDFAKDNNIDFTLNIILKK
jgi:hypothetical protein